MTFKHGRYSCTTSYKTKAGTSAGHMTLAAHAFSFYRQPSPENKLLPTVQQALRVQWRVFGVFVCFDLYFVNYRSWQAEICKSVLKDVFK